jgi:hypothetical protein
MAALLPIFMFNFGICCTGLCQKSHHYRIENSKLHFIDGCFGHHVREVTLEKVTEIRVTQRLPGKVLNHGYVVIHLEGEEPVVLKNIPNPHFHKRIIYEIVRPA